MKVFIIPNPWDYHEHGTLLVVANTKERAVEIAKDWAGKHLTAYTNRLKFEEAKELEEKVYECQGCDD